VPDYLAFKANKANALGPAKNRGQFKALKGRRSSRLKRGMASKDRISFFSGHFRKKNQNVH